MTQEVFVTFVERIFDIPFTLSQVCELPDIKKDHSDSTSILKNSRKIPEKASLTKRWD
jgi:hypothetical protein